MDSATPFEPGTVLQPSWDPRPIRVLLCDHIEVLYDSWWPHKNDWGFSALKGRAHYYRISTRLALAKAKVLQIKALSEAERLVHRPDLPLRCCRTPATTWDELATKSEFKIDDLLAKRAPQIAREVVCASQLVLVPFGPNGGQKRGATIQAKEVTGFTGRELLSKASVLQSEQQASRSDGVGVYRLGFHGQTPSFYLWGWRDKANITTD